MRKCLLVFLSFFIVVNLSAQSSSIFSVTSGKINFQSDAPNEMISASSENVIGVINTSQRTFAFKVSIRSFQGFNSALQREHFNENYLESKKYSEATFSGKIIEEVDFSQNGNYTIRAKGDLTIHGVKQERIINSDVQVKDGKLFVRSNFAVALNDHDIPIPKVVKDKLASIINVQLSCLLQPR